MIEHNEKVSVSLGVAGDDSGAAETGHPVVRIPPFTLAEFVTIAREVVQQGGRSRRAVARINVYVDIDGIFRQRRGEPDPTSAEELLAIMKQTGLHGDRRWANQVRELWMDYESACRAYLEFRGRQ